MARIQKTMTPAAEAANRVNGAESGGPASEAGKDRSKMNALKHGKFAGRPDPVELLLAAPSPEEEAEREILRAEVVERYQPPDAFAGQAAEELADLRFELRRLERVKQTLWQRERELLELEQRRRARTVEHRVLEIVGGVSNYQVKRTGVMQAPESPSKYRELVVALEWLKVVMDRRQFNQAWSTLAAIYGDLDPSWRGHKLVLLLHRAEKAAEEAGTEPGAEAKARLERQVEQWLSMFRSMLADELQEVKEKLELCELEQGPLSAAGQAMRLLEATSSRKWGWVRHQENFLRRSIDRRLRILIELRRDHAKAEKQLSDLKPASGGGQPQPPGPLMGRLQQPVTTPGAQPDSRGGSPCPPEGSEPVPPSPSDGEAANDGAEMAESPSAPATASAARLASPPRRRGSTLFHPVGAGGSDGAFRTGERLRRGPEKTRRNHGTNPPSALESINAPAAKPLAAECRAVTQTPTSRRHVSTGEEPRMLSEIGPGHLYWNGHGTAGGHAAPMRRQGKRGLVGKSAEPPVSSNALGKAAWEIRPGEPLG
jgi:hypothetical protein